MKKILLTIVILVNILNANYVEDASKAYSSGNKTKAVELYKKACDIGLSKGCYNLAFHYDTGNGVQQDKRKAVEFFEKTCNLGYSKGCFALGFIYDEGVEGEIKQDKKKAKELWKKACDLGLSDGCKEYKY